ncbi:MAG: tetratricopeptide repeat protein [Polyangiaceae bacterium]|nr:tetratricopeptide repeat protein [Polyangiaceae bacterium]
MLPFEPIATRSPIERLLLSARAADVSAEIERIEALGDLTKAERASFVYTRGAFSLREGSLGPAQSDFEESAALFGELGDAEAQGFCRAEGLLAKMRKGPRQAFGEAAAALLELAETTPSDRVRVVATHYRGAALRLLGDAQGTQRTLLDALAKADVYTHERPKILSSLGTLYVVLGAYGAAEALLEHAVELQHQRGDVVGEAIACGQLGAAALGLGDLVKARTWLQRQEWLTSQVGDAFGRARALTFLADVALDLGKPDDALELASLAIDVARTTKPPLAIWLAYATRAKGRALADLRDATAEAALRDARERFTQIGNILGLALTEWDLVRLGPSDTRAAAEASAPGLTWNGPAWALASLGLSARVASLLRDHAEHAEAGEVESSGVHSAADAEEAFFAVAQAAPHLGVPREIDLVYEAPNVLGDVSNRRTAGQRNLARLGALTLAAPGLLIARAAWKGAVRTRPLPPERAACASIGGMPGAVAWAWPLSTPDADVERDVAALRSQLEGQGASNVTVTLEKQPKARIVCPPFAGEVSATLDGLE